MYQASFKQILSIIESKYLYHYYVQYVNLATKIWFITKVKCFENDNGHFSIIHSKD